MGLFGRDYDREYDRWGRAGGYDRGYRRRGGGGFPEEREWRSGAGGAYDRDLGYPGEARYDREHLKSRWQTDYGDPFGDRTARTPMRVIRRDHARDPWGRSRYEREYETRPSSYDAYYRPSARPGGGWQRGYDRGYRGAGSSGYDRGWF